MGNIFSPVGMNPLLEEEPVLSGIMYGVPSAKERPFIMKSGELSDALKAFLLSEVPCFFCSEKVIEGYAFNSCIDYPFLDRHVYYEGYFHSKMTDDAVLSINPRYGFDFEKPSVHPAFRAFAEAFRRCNAVLTESIVQVMREREDNLACALIARLIEEENHFADLAIQMHYGDEVSGQHLGWHVDTINSSLHCAISMKNHRRLMFKAKTEQGQAYETFGNAQNEGSVYLTSPYSFSHAVNYPKTGSWDNRIIAVQMRFLMDTKDYKEYKTASEEDLYEMQEIITSCLELNDIVMPSLEQVQEIYNTILSV
eukprot:TRINITY_DN4119_c0_g1_i1.p1 TRINITY_DN4119_c0_g1~~TRINITY_DN4119_c0_g1_i1.p1  ORF type:complete len:320 (-),score=61.69 TRINITY_DN4119_c0_g1_i1:9-938(-)